MKITKIVATKRSDLIKQRDEYDAETRKYSDRIEEGHSNWSAKLKEQADEMERKISNLIGNTSLALEITADPWANYDRGWGVRVRANERTMFDDKVALAWNWEAKIDRNGNVIKDSGSWSGLKAITPDQISDLEESVRVLKVLNNIDWSDVLNSPKSKPSDFVSQEDSEMERSRRKNRPNFEADIETATIEDAIASGDIAFELEQDSYYRGHVGIIPTGVTDKFIKGYIFPISYVDTKSKSEIIDTWAREPRRTSRSNLVKRSGELVSYKLK